MSQLDRESTKRRRGASESVPHYREEEREEVRHRANHPDMALAPLMSGDVPAAATNRVWSNEMRDQLRLICDAAAGFLLADQCFYTFDRLPIVRRKYDYLVALECSYDRLHAQGKVSLSLKERMHIPIFTDSPPPVGTCMKPFALYPCGTEN